MPPSGTDAEAALAALAAAALLLAAFAALVLVPLWFCAGLGRRRGPRPLRNLRHAGAGRPPAVATAAAAEAVWASAGTAPGASHAALPARHHAVVPTPGSFLAGLRRRLSGGLEFLGPQAPAAPSAPTAPAAHSP